MNAERFRTVAEAAFVVFILACLLCLLFTMAEDIERLKRITTPRIVGGNEKGPAELTAGPLDLATEVQLEMPLEAS